MALSSDSIPLTLGGAEDEIVFERFWAGLVGVVPAREEDEPALFAVGREDEGFGAGTVFKGVLGGVKAALGTGRPGAAAVAFFGGVFGFVEIFSLGKHLISELIVAEGRSRLAEKIR